LFRWNIRGRKSRHRNRDAVSDARITPDSFELLANNLKTAAKQVDNSAARVEVALKPLMAA
jgi:hypothetical protein